MAARTEALELDLRKAEEPLLPQPDNGRPARGAGRVVQLFTNVSMGKGHDGLAMLCDEYGIDVVNLEPGQYVVFTNRRRDKVKVFAANNVLAYLKLPQGHFLSLETIALIPTAFRGTADIEHDRTLREVFQGGAEARRVRMPYTQRAAQVPVAEAAT